MITAVLTPTGMIMTRKKGSSLVTLTTQRSRPARGRPCAERTGEWGASALAGSVPPRQPTSDRPRTDLDSAGGRKLAGAPASAALYRLMAWLSPAYPVGAFSYSSGIEWAVQAGDICDADRLQGWIAATIRQGGGFCDAVFFSHAHRAITDHDDAGLHAVAEIAAAFAPSKERFLETTAQGRAFLDTTRAAWPCAALGRLRALWTGPVAYPVAVAVTSAAHDVPLAPALNAYLHAICANLISAGVRLVPLGQTSGQRALAALEPVVAEAAERALRTPLDDVGTTAFRADLASMHHETQYTRLFRS
jgi:urease accessory protein